MKEFKNRELALKELGLNKNQVISRMGKEITPDLNKILNNIRKRESNKYIEPIFKTLIYNNKEKRNYPLYYYLREDFENNKLKLLEEVEINKNNRRKKRFKKTNHYIKERNEAVKNNKNLLLILGILIIMIFIIGGLK